MRARVRSESYVRVQRIGGQLLLGLPAGLVREAGIVRRALYVVEHQGGGVLIARPLDRDTNARLRRV